jgi:hypothetical protein
MFFADHEKLVYAPAGSDLALDPLALDRRLTLATGGRLHDLWSDWKAREGDASVAGTNMTAAEAALTAARAEEQIAAAARLAFGLPAFPDGPPDAVVLEYLCDFQDWLKKKGRRGDPPPASPTTSPGPS